MKTKTSSVEDTNNKEKIWKKLIAFNVYISKEK